MSIQRKKHEMPLLPRESRICSFDEFVSKRRKMKGATLKINQHISKKEIENAWDLFNKAHR